MADLNDLARDLMRMQASYKAKKPVLMKDLGEALRAKIQDSTPVDTGKLKSSYEVRVSKDEAEVATSVDYAPYVNDGHAQGGSFIPGRYMFEKGILQVGPTADRLVGSFMNSIEGIGE